MAPGPHEGARAVARRRADDTIVSVATPTTIQDRGLDLSDAQWLTAIYSLVFAALLITVGRLGDRFGRRLLFVLGLVVFVAASIFAGRSGSGSELFLARFFQGIGAAMILPSSLSTVNAVFTGRARACAFAVWGSVIADMAAVGPVLGGWLTTDHSWRWAFYINVPIGILVISARSSSSTRRRTKPLRADGTRPESSPRSSRRGVRLRAHRGGDARVVDTDRIARNRPVDVA